MKLISCYIENFGNISRREIDFNAGLTALCERNGYGKTTLAAFLKAMFYGFGTTRKNEKELGERARYYPFGGGEFGGNVVVEKDGATYKTERFFGEKSATGDKTSFYKNGVLLPDGTDIGKEIFGMDEQSFLKTVYLTSADTEAGATGDISRMLSGFVDDADFEGAKSALEEEQKEYKKRGGGKIAEKREEIIELKNLIKNKEVISAGLDGKYARRTQCAEDIVRLEGVRSAAADRNIIFEKWKTYDGCVADAAAERVKLNEIYAKYPDGLPTAAEAETLKLSAERLKLANERLASTEFTAEKRERLAHLSSRFSEGVPTEEETRKANGKATELIRLEAEIENCKNLLNGCRAVEFPAGIPDESEVEKYGEKLVAARDKNRRATSAGAGKKIPVVLALFAIILLGAGVGLLFVNTAAGAGVLVLGAVDVVAAIFTYFNVQIKGIKGKALEDENEIASFLARYGYYSGGGVEVDFNNLSRDLQTYKSVGESREKYTQLLSEKTAAAESAKSEVVAFLARFGFAGENAQEDLARLNAFAAEYASLNHEKDDISRRTARSREEADSNRAAAERVLSAYSIAPSENLTELAERVWRDAVEADRLKESVSRLERKAESFKAENKLVARPEEDVSDTRAIDEELKEKRGELSLLDREITDDETAVERLEELREKLAAAEAEEERLNKKYVLLCKTLELIERAEGNLKDRYISPVKNSFLYYGGLLEKTLGEKVVFDKDFKVKFERGGRERPDAHLSAGQKSLCALCLRLALIDNMYKDGKPFIIMDDPFVHLDEEHMRRARQLLCALAEARQIIYFCCHESRKV